MLTSTQTKTATPADQLADVIAREQNGLIILSSAKVRSTRRVLYINSYGGREVWTKVKAGLMPGHHLWGCVQLVQLGYEVGLAPPLTDFNPYRRPLPHDLTLFKFVAGWLRRDDIVFCAHNVLFWIPFLRRLGVARRHIVSLLFAREPLDMAGAHSGVIALTPTAEVQAKKLAPKAKVVHLGWGADLSSYPRQTYTPRYLLHCGIAGRDFNTLHQASVKCHCPVRIIASHAIGDLAWPKTVEVIESGLGYNHEEKKVTFHELVNTHYAGAAASLIVTMLNPGKDHALGFTNLIEALAMGQPIIHTQTGALADEIDVEREGCGLGVPPEDPAALAAAMATIMNDRDRSAAMAKASRRLAETHYNIDRFATELHRFFASL